MKIRQVPMEPFPHGGVPVALIAVEPRELVERFGVVLEQGWDNLDTLDVVAFALPDGSQVRLTKHHHDPQYDGMAVIADAALPSEVIRLVQDALDLDDARVTWRLADELRDESRGYE